MNILIVFVAGISAGWAADKLYQSVVASKQGKPDKGLIREDVVTEAKPSDEATDDIIGENDPASLEEIHDDLSQIKGVGPKLAEALNTIGIYNYKQLSSSPVDKLIEQLKETGGRFSKSVISSIVEQAKSAS